MTPYRLRYIAQILRSLHKNNPSVGPHLTELSYEVDGFALDLENTTPLPPQKIELREPGS